MKASVQQQQDLLGLGDIDLEISRSKSALAAMTNGATFVELRSRQRDMAADLIAARNALDSVSLELTRAEADLELVEQRIEKDRIRLNSTNSAKDAQGIQSELESLQRRKSDLEDAEIAILEKKELAQANFDDVLVTKNTHDAELAELESSNEAAVLKLRSGLDLLVNKRAQQAAKTDPELLSLYEKKLARGTAVAKLNVNECGACRIGLGATALAEIHAKPADEIVSCPECQALLVR